MTDHANFSATKVSGVAVFSVRGEIDILNSADLRSALYDTANDSSGPLVVSLLDVAYFDSQTLEILFEFAKRLELNRRKMAIVAPPDSPARKLLDISGISGVIPTYRSLDEAISGSVAGQP